MVMHGGTERTRKVAVLLQRAIANIMTRKLNDPRLPTMLSIAEVQVNKDFSRAKVFVSLMGSKDVLQSAVELLNHAAPFIRRQLFDEVVLKQVPQLHFVADTSIADGQRLSQTIDNVSSSSD